MNTGIRKTRLWTLGLLAVVGALGACADDEIFVPVDGDPAPPRALEALYYDRAVILSWELHPQWDGESFRVYGKRVSDPDFFLIAEVTSCSAGLCSYTDTNVLPDHSYRYFVAAVDPDTGGETSSEETVEVFVPQPVAPPVPTGIEIVALDGSNYVRWDDNARASADFSFYRVYLDDGTTQGFLLGETDSQGFLDELAENGVTSAYFVTAVDDQGHESGGSSLAEGTPRPDFTGEVVYAFQDQPGLSGFRFENDESIDPIVDGTSPLRDFRLELDAQGWWLVPDVGVEVTPNGFATTALKCGPGADAGCVDVSTAPTSAGAYTTADVALFPQTSYVLRYVASDGLLRYGVIRVTLLGFDQNNDALMIFDWAHQTQPDNPDLSVIPSVTTTD